ncbi:sel1 repeat family protein [Rhodosalinus sediminis]|uniref:Sel1 repeat family protein n=2 Tax=Rhodosalinus sediminis TaxID=1940533 RepID=A0A3D9BJP5_9RHOB|nr:sel1 repeat family protein [Rhodosalinus sediminis]
MYKKAVELYEFGSSDSSFVHAFNLLKPLAEKGWSNAQVLLAYLYKCGKGVELSCEKSEYWYKQAAAQGNQAACHNLAIHYGTDMSEVEKAYWALKAARLGSEPMQRTTALNYYLGWGIPQNYLYAHAWFNVARANGEEVQEYLDKLEEFLPTEEICKSQEMARQLFEEIHLERFDSSIQK